MNSRASVFRFAASTLALIAGAPAHAQDLDIGVIVITPDRAPIPKKRSGSKVETVSRDEIAAQGKPGLVETLDLLPGIHVASPGGSGQEASLSVRGADKKYVKTLWNGIDIADPSSTQVQVGFQHLGTFGIGGLEVLKGSQGAHYGSEAVAGVIALDTLGGIESGLHHEIAIEGGSRGTVTGGYRATHADDNGRASLFASGLSTNGFSAALANGAAPLDDNPGALEPDFYRNGSAGFAFDRAVNDRLSVFGAGLFIAAAGAFDDSGNPPTDNAFNDGASRQLAGRLGFTAKSPDGRMRNTFAAQAYDIDRDLHLVSAFGPYDANYKGRRLKADYLGAFDLSDRLNLQWGADYEWQGADSTDSFFTVTSDSAATAGVFAQAIFTPIEGLTLDASLRHDIHSAYGGHTTWRASATWALSGGTRLHGSAGTGYRAPSLYELYAPFGTGNAALQPETSFSADVGIEQTALDGRLVVDVTAFMLNTANLIDYDFATFSYQQVPGVTRRAGVE
ncbi:MAG: TonB-dependent receptor, partial [Rhizobiaceae bacterium]